MVPASGGTQVATMTGVEAIQHGEFRGIATTLQGGKQHSKDASTIMLSISLE